MDSNELEVISFFHAHIHRHPPHTLAEETGVGGGACSKMETGLSTDLFFAFYHIPKFNNN